MAGECQDLSGRWSAATERPDIHQLATKYKADGLQETMLATVLVVGLAFLRLLDGPRESLDPLCPRIVLLAFSIRVAVCNSRLTPERKKRNVFCICGASSASSGRRADPTISVRNSEQLSK